MNLRQVNLEVRVMEPIETRIAKFRYVMKTFVRKWTVEIMYCLYTNDTMRFSELMQMLGGISSRTLSDRLKQLGDLGLVDRDVVPDKPVKINYSLTPAGKKLGERAYVCFNNLIDAWDEVMSDEEDRE